MTANSGHRRYQYTVPQMVDRPVDARDVIVLLNFNIDPGRILRTLSRTHKRQLEANKSAARFSEARFHCRDIRAYEAT